MHEINCPHCGKAFKIDEAGYADILKQVRDGDIDQQLHDRLELAEPDADSEEARTLRPLQAAAITYRIAFGDRKSVV